MLGGGGKIALSPCWVVVCELPEVHVGSCEIAHVESPFEICPKSMLGLAKIALSPCWVAVGKLPQVHVGWSFENYPKSMLGLA